MSTVITLFCAVVVREGILRDPDKVVDPEIVTVLPDRLVESQAKLPSPSSNVRGAFFIEVAPAFASEDVRNISPII